MYKVKVENKKQLDVVIKEKKVSDIILARDSFNEIELPSLINQIKKNNKSAWIMLERISRFEEKMNNNVDFQNKNSVKKVKQNKSYIKIDDSLDLRKSTDKIYEIENLDGVIIQNLDSFAYMLRNINKASNQNLKIELNYTMNCYNFESKKLYTNMYIDKRVNGKDMPLLFTAPVELNIYELGDVVYDTMVVYSYIDTMVAANCLRKNTSLSTNNNCANRFNFNKVEDNTSYIIDRKGKKIHYKAYCKYCYNKIFNTVPLYLIDKIEEIDGYEILSDNSKSKYRIDFSFETADEVQSILNNIIPNEFTRGHFKNSIN